MFAAFTTNWKTTLAGALPVALAGVELFGIDIPGFSLSMSEAVNIFLVAVLARDAVSKPAA